MQTESLVRFRTLVVEDNKHFLDLLRGTLQNYPWVDVISQAESGIDAVERALALQPDLILLDIGLPGLNGIDAAHRIRTLAPEAKIIFVTQESSTDVVDEALGRGAWGFVLKASYGRDLPLAIDAVSRGRRFVSEGLDGRGL